MRAYNYIRYFLSNRTAKIRIGKKTSQPIFLGDKGTPQGSVLSPLLLNMALLPLRKLLESIDGLGYPLYADDITL